MRLIEYKGYGILEMDGKVKINNFDMAEEELRGRELMAKKPELEIVFPFPIKEVDSIEEAIKVIDEFVGATK